MLGRATSRSERQTTTTATTTTTTTTAAAAATTTTTSNLREKNQFSICFSDTYIKESKYFL